MKKSVKGFTLIEVILYLAVFSTFILVLSAFTELVYDSRIKNQVIAEVGQQGVLISRIILKEISSAQSVSAPLSGQTAESISYINEESSASGIMFNDESVELTKGGQTAQLNNGQVKVSDLEFSNFSLPGTPTLVRIKFTLTYNSQNSNYVFSQTYEYAASLSQ